VPLHGRPILDYLLDFYRSFGLDHFVLCVGYCGAQFRSYYAHPPNGVRLEFSDEGEDASMLRRIWSVQEWMSPRIMVSYGDTFTDLDLAGMLALHLARGALVTIAIARIRSPFGLVTFDADGWVSSFTEKPSLRYYIGHFLLERAALDYVTPEMLPLPDGEGLVRFFEVLAEARRLCAFEHQGLQITFNTESERRQAEEDLGRFYTFPEDTWQS
jgi:NDP-sugar pyrophosphorylase family protein